jgi:hypothetical protein
MGRKPVEPPTKMRKILEKAALSGESVNVDGITLYPPRADRRRWRVKVHFEKRAFDKTYKDSATHTRVSWKLTRGWLS